jgi:hypothetical protein
LPNYFSEHSGKEIDDILAAIQSVTDIMYPVGSIFMSISDTNPAAYFGGTWAAWGAGRVPVGIDAGQTEFNTVEKTGGEKEHTLTTDEMPAHTHTTKVNTSLTMAITAGVDSYRCTGSSATPTGSTGGGDAHNNLQPYITCYMWKRIA